MKKTIDISSDLIYDLIKLLDIFVLEMIDMKLKNLKNMREAAGLTQKQASEKIGVGQNTLSYWENETYDIDTGSLQKIADYFGVTTDYVLCRDSAPVSQPTTDRTVSDEDIMFALFDGDKDITPEMFDEVKQFARFVRERHKK